MGCLLGEEWSRPRVVELPRTGSGFFLGCVDGGRIFKQFLGGEDDMIHVVKQGNRTLLVYKSFLRDTRRHRKVFGEIHSAKNVGSPRLPRILGWSSIPMALHSAFTWQRSNVGNMRSNRGGTPMTDNDSFQAGYGARWDGVDVEDNPYRREKNGDEFQSWVKGWREADTHVYQYVQCAERG